MVTCTEQFFATTAASVHGGVDQRELVRLGVDPAAIIDFSSNQSPLGASPDVKAAIAGAVVDAYPDRDARPLTAVIAAHHALAPAQVVVGNGSTELIRLIAQLALRPGDKTLALHPSFGEYVVATQLAGAEYVSLLTLPGAQWLERDTLAQALDYLQPRIFWWCAPNNPTGIIPHPEDIAELVTAYPRTLFVLDEAYCDLLPEAQWSPALLECGNLLILRSLTKAWGLAGLRLGYVLGSETLMAPLRAAKAPWNVNACAQAAGMAALEDAGHYAGALALLREQKGVLVSGLRARGWEVLPSAAAFFLVRAGDAGQLRHALLAHGCLVRDCTSFDLPAYIRISPRRPEQNQQLLAAFDALGGMR